MEENTKNAEEIEKEKKEDAESPNGEPVEDQQVLVGITIEEFDKMKDELEAAQAESKKNLDGWQRALADFTNFKRRTERDYDRTRADVTVSVVKKFVDILDDLELALKNRPKEGDGAAWAEGIEIVYKKVLTSLEYQNVVVMETEGQLFDPHFHEAISQEESPDHESGAIIEVLKPGFMIGERVLRPALVRVAA